LPKSTCGNAICFSKWSRITPSGKKRPRGKAKPKRASESASRRHGNASNAAIDFTITNSVNDGTFTTGVCDVTISNVDFTSTNGIRQIFAGSNFSRFSAYILDNTNLARIDLDRDSGVGAGTDQLVILHVGLTATYPDTATATDAQIEEVLVNADANDNDNGGSSPTVTVTDEATGDPAQRLMGTATAPTEP